MSVLYRRPSRTEFFDHRKCRGQRCRIHAHAGPAWLDEAHSKLDAAVAAAFGWSADISEEDALNNSFILNQARASSARDQLPTTVD